jgi:hypothetical protein
MGRWCPWFGTHLSASLEEQEQALEAELEEIRRARKEQEKS